MRRASAALVLSLLGAALLAGRASAHAGLTAPAATADLARVSSAPSGVEAKVVDGDQRLWLRVAPTLTVVVRGLRGEPYLRFSRAGVAVNVHSATWFLNRPVPQVVPPRLGAPAWQRLTSAHSTSWHEDRLHAAALAAHPAGNAYLGRWLVPLLVDGRPAAIRGGLWQGAAPSWLWFWPLALLAACVPALIALRQARWDGIAQRALAALALAAATTGRLGRELYGRPSVSAGQLVLVGATCAVAVVLALLFLQRDWRTAAGLAIGAAALYQGLALIGTLRNAFVLAVLPAWAERAATVASLTAGVGLLVVVLTSSVSGAEPLDDEWPVEGPLPAGAQPPPPR
ncbi:MAG: hypothetical protein JO073_05095 [Actinobacteria bacterium]|nr:hypothetical protein [Actinomycetota bacterium]